MSQSYRVMWEMDVDADSPHEAAEQARQIQLDPEAQVGHFTVVDESSVETDVDLTP